MTCGEAAHLLYLYCTRPPTTPALERLHAHLGACPRCTRFVRDMSRREDLTIDCGEIPDELFGVLEQIVAEQHRAI